MRKKRTARNGKEPWQEVRVEFRWPRWKAEAMAKDANVPHEIRQRIRNYLGRYPTPESVAKREAFLSQFFTNKGGEPQLNTDRTDDRADEPT